MTFLRQYPWLFFLILITILLSAYLYVKDILLISDEGIYYHVIRAFAQGKLPIQEYRYVTVLPLFLFVTGILVHLAGFANADHKTMIGVIRGILLCYGVCSIFLFFFISRRMTAKYSLYKTLQYVFSPLFFPFFFLIYTEIFSLLFILASFYLLLKKKYLLSGIVALMSIFIRQDNIFWIGFFCLYIFLDMLSLKRKKFFIEYIKHTGIFICSFAVLGILIVFNKGNIAIGDANKHPLSFHMGNVYFFLLLQFFLFPFYHIFHISKIVEFIKKHPIVVILCMLSLSSFFFFRIDHQYNQLKGLGVFYVRNHVLHFIVSTIPVKIITFFTLVWVLLSLVVTKFRDKKAYSIYLFIFLALSMHWLIDPRYAFIPIAFFTLFKEEESQRVEILQVLYSIFLTIITFFIVFETKFFI